MKKNRSPRGRRRDNRPLRASLADRLGSSALARPSGPTPQAQMPRMPQMPRLPRPARSARDVLTLLTAATGLVLAGQPGVEVELLPGTPTTVLITNGGRAQAAFVLPVPHEEACRALGHPVIPGPDPELDLLWYEEQVARQASHAG